MIQDVNVAAYSAAQSALNFCSLLKRYTRCVTATRTSSRLPSPADAATAAVRLEIAGDRKIIRVEKSRRSVSDREREFIYQVHIHNIYISIITMAGCQ